VKVKVVERGRRFGQEESGRFQERYPEWQQNLSLEYCLEDCLGLSLDLVLCSLSEYRCGGNGPLLHYGLCFNFSFGLVLHLHLDENRGYCRCWRFRYRRARHRSCLALDNSACLRLRNGRWH
jgi:hypothetical protein